MNIRELGADQSVRAFEAMRELRPAFTEHSFVSQVATQMKAGYRLAAAFDAADRPAVSVVGFRFAENLAWGRHCYIDDLSTMAAARGRGAASLLLGWVAEEARRAGMSQLHLDSGVQVERQDAHRLYFRAGYRISSFHFSRQL
ncbi:GNAT family N-acetyltransferase [Rathayibacter toxicus]|uniref:GNAT family N-acetyltransferase n=1 Tax=Rathayibacter toxicus TaxID=145458 RepID=A0A0C5BHE7_9MICO|nr:GNAT family N-acetyltransferase [Rathayibacter toxicus]AJM77665.1 hypothetical protein TI83_06375 [Rathayibacter toxicus]ALS56395.1 hypothetical protein APU90_00105 [Rathayibacter toxicus]KKM44505.1 hypothetical protein VT73_08065 [Rathayibacter toxicus]PPG21787.1 GNAT family N-acetyltransferase [Rathayibacter toxicus]PPG46749.1 GNAT family N-acetyltransferase [Rathayibacter toxicus]